MVVDFSLLFYTVIGIIAIFGAVVMLGFLITFKIIHIDPLMKKIEGWIQHAEI